MGTSDKARIRLRSLSRDLSDKEIDETYGPKAQPTIRAARDVGNAVTRKAPSTGDTKGPRPLSRAVHTANLLKGTTDKTAAAINSKRSRAEEIQRAIDNE